MPVRKTASFQVKHEAVDECLEAIREFVGHIVANEPGTIEYASWQDIDDPTRFDHRMIFEDEAAQNAHSESEAVQKFTGILYPNLEGPVDFRTLREVAGK